MNRYFDEDIEEEDDEEESIDVKEMRKRRFAAKKKVGKKDRMSEYAEKPLKEPRKNRVRPRIKWDPDLDPTDYDEMWDNFEEF